MYDIIPQIHYCLRKEAVNMCMNNEGEYGKYILQDIILPAVMSTPEAEKQYYGIGRRRILWIDGNNMAGANFQMNSTWIVHADREIHRAEEADGKVDTRGKQHSHDTDELLSFLGSNPDDPSDLCGEVEFYIEGEKHILTKSTYVYLPAGVKHSPLYMNRVDRPIFHFSLVFGPKYHMNLADGSVYLAE